MILNNILSNWDNVFLEINKVLDKSFIEYIKGKRVVIIGPSEFLVDKKLKEFIDNNDIIIRINLGYKLTMDKNSNDFGSKTDVIYLNQKIRYFGNNYHNNIIQELENNNIPEYIVLNCAGLPKLIDDYKHENKYTNIIHSDLNNIKKILNINTNLYMGTQIILEILACNPTDLILVGIDFYSNKCCKTYNENNILFDKNYEINNEKNNNINNNHINLNNNFDFHLFAFICGIKDMLPSIKNVNIILDSFLNSLINDYKIIHNNFKK